jgi:hypothetical protein
MNDALELMYLKDEVEKLRSGLAEFYTTTRVEFENGTMRRLARLEGRVESITSDSLTAADSAEETPPETTRYDVIEDRLTALELLAHGHKVGGDAPFQDLLNDPPVITPRERRKARAKKKVVIAPPPPEVLPAGDFEIEEDPHGSNIPSGAQGRFGYND